MNMFNDRELSTLAAKVRKLIYDIMAVGPLDEKPAMFAQARSLLDLLEKHFRDIPWYIQAYPQLRFEPTESLPIIIRADRTTTRAQAVDLRNRLQFDGLMFFRLYFGSYGDFVEPVRDTVESTALDTARLDYGMAWNVFRNESNDTFNFVRLEPEPEDSAQSLADSMADECKTRWPWAWIVVKVPIAVPEGAEPREPAKASRKLAQ